MALSQEQILALPEPITVIFRRLEHDIVAKIAGHIGDVGRLTATDVHRLKELERVGFNLREIRNAIAGATNQSRGMVEGIFEDAARREYQSFKNIFETTGRRWVPFEQNERLQMLLAQMCKITEGTFNNFPGTLGFIGPGGQWSDLVSFYHSQIDYAVATVKLGQTNVYSAMHTTVRDMADRGITRVDWAGGYQRRMDSSARMNILGGLSKLSQAQSELIGHEIGADGYEVTFHMGYRPSHDFGGLQFSEREFHQHIRAKMDEPNCYHRSFPIVMGVSTPAYSQSALKSMIAENEAIHRFEGKPYDRYSTEQKQRRYETAIRQQKDRINAFEAMGDSGEADIAKAKLTQLRVNYKRFSGAVDLKTKPTRTRVAR